MLIGHGRRLAGFRRGRRFLGRLHFFPGFRAGATRFFVALSMFPVATATMLIIMSRSPLLVLRVGLMRRLPWRLDAAQCPAKFFNLALVGEFLTLSNFDQFKNFIQKVNCVLQRFRNFGGMRHRLADGRGFGRAKISRFAPLPGLRTAMFVLGRMSMRRRTRTRWLPLGGRGRFRLGLGRRSAFGSGFGSRLRRRLTVKMGTFLGRPGLAGLLRMRFAEASRRIGFRLGDMIMRGRFLGGRRGGRHVLRRRFRFIDRRARSARATTAAATTAAPASHPSAGTAGRGRRI